MDYMNDDEITIGKVNGQDFSLNMESRLNNVAVYGAKGSGKTRQLFSYFANLQMGNKDEGATFVVEGAKQALILREIAKKYQRKAIMLHPDMNESMHELVYLNFDSEKEITNKVVDFEKVLKDKQIIIIDVQMAKTHKKGLNALINLMYLLQMNLHHNTVDTPHFVYIDHAELVFSSLYNLLYFGGQHGVGTVLFFQSREYISKVFPEQTLMMEGNIRTNIVYQSLTYEDRNYFMNRFYGGAGSLSETTDKNALMVETCVDGKFEVNMVSDIGYLKDSHLMEIEESVMDAMKKKTKKKTSRKRDPKPPHISKTLYTPHENMKKIPLSEEGFDEIY